ncbi:hypothetical protein LH128_07737 [Sphingomonas sp. LH128]|uniref:hypothetical protein n=1 Tax=Sphingomonas sp. LH128 TaxID=473781 RepID=UPI00027CC756|nr:hypothetical protein [Sphingomonas sp. LH128]EJU13639.1 hypothetical protein LH128_07737 [Sphingomonas sp. LH128]
MTEDTPHEHPEVDAVTGEEVAAGMTDEQLLSAWEAVTDPEHLTVVEQEVLAEIERRRLSL